MYKQLFILVSVCVFFTLSIDTVAYASTAEVDHIRITVYYTPASTLNAPTNLTTSSASTGVSLSWTAPSGSPTTYGIWRGTSSFSATTSATLIASISSAATNYTDTSATRGTTYFYRVTATDGNGTSTLSNQKASSKGSGRIIRLGGLLYIQ